MGPEANTANHGRLLAHEYHHMAAARAGMRLPRWLSEGLAELYSTVESAGDKTLIGEPILITCRLLRAESGSA